RRLNASVLDTDVPAGDTDRLVEAILTEWGATDRLGEVCHRRGVRYRPALRPIAAPYQPWRADDQAAYVVVGGTRGLGALVAGFLAARGARQIALIGTRPVDRDIANDPALTGVRVLTHAGSVADTAGLAGFLDRVRTELGPIDGVVNCAGRSGQGVGFAYLDPARLAETLEPKADGIETLTDLTAADRPSFSVQFSSISAVAPTLAAGVTDYAAANACLDRVTEHRIAAGQSWLRSINWPQWSQTGGGRGQPNPCAGLGIATLDDDAGLRVLERVLAVPTGTVAVPLPALDAAVDLAGVLAVGDAAVVSTVSAVDGVDVGAAGRVLLPAAADEGGTAADEGGTAASGVGGPPAWLVDIFAERLRIPAGELDPTASFGDLGVESIMLGELLLAIEEQLGRPLEPSLLLDHPTLESLTAHLDVGISADAVPEAPTAEPVPTARAAEARSEQPSQPSRRQPPDHHIAVIGMSCRFPGAPDTDTFWANLLAGRCTVDEVPASRWDHRRHYRPQLQPGFSISKWGGFVEGIEDFDPGYFRLGDAEATGLDPAIRMVLEGSVACVRDAGYTDADLGGGPVGVFVGARLGDYGRRVPSGPGVLRSDQNFIAAHVAHFFDFHGPNLVVDSACSSSLAAVQTACRSLLAGESAAALAAGVEVLLDEFTYIDLSAARALSPTGRCRTFDRDADGFVPGEGCGVVLLKPLAAALADGDRVRGVIEAVALNNDGRTMGITTPNPAAQASVVRAALTAAGREAREIGLVEAHGTGTLIGDPIELRALTDAFGIADEADADDAPTGWCAIGSVKSNIGHTLSAAGLAGLAKAVLAVEHGMIPATLFCDTPNPRFDFHSSAFRPATATRPWPAPPAERVAGVSSFGLGGTNAHLIVSGFDPAWRAGHPEPRPALPPPVFARRRLWLDPVPEPASASALTSAPAPVPAQASQPAPNSAPEPAPAPAPLTASLLDLRLSVDGAAVATPRRS
ncbi:MAG: SDR family NAD(P)-dependent oxidoreductase, partial [Catenulispora sp.]|nr:SDR family NAD(P)-dependent oxidoreductase [Catenulispora sp.]